MLFGIGSHLLGDFGQSLFLTSLFAAMIAFPSAVGRYQFPPGREEVLPSGLGGLAGLLWALLLRQSRPATYRRIGQGGG
jgi:hypothetical protein